MGEKWIFLAYISFFSYLCARILIYYERERGIQA